MPIYEYQCDECQNQFQELVMSRAAERDVACPKCGSGSLAKLLSGSAIHGGKSGGDMGGCDAPSAPSFGGGCCGGMCGGH